MDSYYLFGYFWMGGVALVGVYYLAWAIKDLRAGTSQVFRYSLPVDRDEEPYQFWLAITGKFLGALVIAPLMLLFGSGMLDR